MGMPGGGVGLCINTQGVCVCPEKGIKSSVLDMFILRCLFYIQVVLLSRWLDI